MKVCFTCAATFDGTSWTCPSCGTTPTQNGRVTFVEGEPDGYHDELFEVLRHVEAESFWFRGRNRIIQWAVQRYFPTATSMLEVGCGTGFVLQGLHETAPRLRLTGGELYSSGLDVAAQRVPDVELLQFDARRIPFVDEFDIVGSFDVLEHIPDDKAALAQFRSAVHAGGGLLVTVPQHRWLWSEADRLASHQRRYTRSDLRRLVTGAGFDVIRLTSFVALLLPLMAAPRLRKRIDGADYDISAELRGAGLLNGLFSRAMDAELAAIRRGVSFPAGGSLLLVGRAR